jgi:hypothetical protein
MQIMTNGRNFCQVSLAFSSPLRRFELSNNAIQKSRLLFTEQHQSVSSPRLTVRSLQFTLRKPKTVMAHASESNKYKSSTESTGLAVTQIRIGGVPQELNDQALRAAVEQSGDDSEVTVHIDVAEDLRETRLDTFLSSRITALSRSALARLIKSESVSLNGRVPKPASKLRAGDHIIVHLPPPPNSDVSPENIPLHILLEDDQIIVINKQVKNLIHI